MESLNNIFSKSVNIPLNISESKTIEVILQSVYPTVKLTIELKAVARAESVFFSIETWRTLLDFASQVHSEILHANGKIIFINDELKVYTQNMHNKWVLCFLDVKGARVNMMLSTFWNMIQLENDVKAGYRNTIDMIQKTAKSVKDFIDLILTMGTSTKQCNDIRNHLEMLNNYTESDLLNEQLFSRNNDIYKDVFNVETEEEQKHYDK